MLLENASTAVAALAAAVDDVLNLQAWQLPATDLGEVLTAVAGQEARLASARLALLAEADERRAGRSDGYLTTGSWYAASTHSRVRDGNAATAVATALAGPLTATGEALAAALITEAHAGVIARVMGKVAEVVAPGDETTVGEVEAFLLGVAQTMDPDQLAVAGKHLLARLRSSAAGSDAEKAEDAALAELGVTLVQNEDGSWFLRGTLDAVGGATLSAALDSASAPRPAGPANAGGGRDLRTSAQRRGEALVHIADAYLAGHGGGAGSRPRVTVSVDLETVVDPFAPGAAPGEMTVPGCGDRFGGHPIAPSTLESMMCDAEVVPVLFDRDGVPLDVGSTIYAFPEKIRKAIIARDGGCTLPHQCGRPPSWCQVHHLVPFGKGGPTSERNGALVCTPGHLFIHRNRWSGRLEGDEVIWRPPEHHRRPGTSAELSPPPPWKPALDALIAAWRERLRRADVLDETG